MPPEPTFPHGDDAEVNYSDSIQDSGRFDRFNPKPLSNEEIGLILDSCSTGRHRRLYKNWVPVGSTCLILVLLLSTAWLGMLNLSQRSQVGLLSDQWRGRGTSRVESARLRVEPARFLLKFDETITEGDIRNLLLKIEGKFVGGPSDGFYTVESGRAVEEVIRILDDESQIEEYKQVNQE